MAYLTKEQYERRRENAAIRNAANSQKAIENGLTEAQAEAIERLCSVRHEFHSNLNNITQSDDYQRKRKLIDANKDIAAAGLAPMPFIPTSHDDYIDIDTIAELYEIYGTFDYDEEYSRIYSELEALNQKIEAYLSGIDQQYGTAYCPTGLQRIY